MAVNPARIKLTRGNHLAAINLIVHELLHIMGVNIQSFSVYPSKDGRGIVRMDSKGRAYLISPTLIEEAKDHFNCPSIDKSIPAPPIMPSPPRR